MILFTWSSNTRKCLPLLIDFTRSWPWRPAWLLQRWRFQAVLDSAVKKFDRTKIIFQWLRGGEVDKNRGFIKYASLSTVGSQWMTSPHLTEQAGGGVLKLKIIILNIKLFIIPFYHCWMSRRTVTPKLCPWSSVHHLALETFHLAGHDMCHEPPCAETFIPFCLF